MFDRRRRISAASNAAAADAASCDGAAGNGSQKAVAGVAVLPNGFAAGDLRKAAVLQNDWNWALRAEAISVSSVHAASAWLLAIAIGLYVFVV